MCRWLERYAAEVAVALFLFLATAAIVMYGMSPRADAVLGARPATKGESSSP